MAVDVMPIDASTGGSPAPTYTAEQFRLAWSVLFGLVPTGGSLGVSSGVRDGTPSSTLGLSGSNWTVAAHSGALQGEGASAGPYVYATDGTDSGTLNAADGSNPRIDILYVQVYDTELDGSGERGGAIVYLAGTAASSPVAPTPPAHTMTIAEFQVPKSGSGSPTGAWVAPTLGWRPVARLGLNSDQTGIVASTWTPVVWTEALENTGGMWSSGADLTVAVPGLYVIDVEADWDDSNTSGPYGVRVTQNSGALANQSGSYTVNNNTNHVSLSGIARCAVGDTIEVDVYQDGNVGNGKLAAAATIFSMVRIGA